MRMMLCLATLCCFLELGVRAQDNPVAAQVERLMGQPKDSVNLLVNFPWKAESPDALPGFRRVPHGQTIRIVSVQKPVEDTTQWTHWESEDGLAWVDLVNFTNPYGAAATLQSARQLYSGYRSVNQLILFSGTGNLRREAVGATLIGANASLLNVGLRLPIEVHWDRPLPEADRVAFDAALVRFQSILNTLARAFLNPAYVSLGPRLSPRLKRYRFCAWRGSHASGVTSSTTSCTSTSAPA
jgi:hypothetical protein